MPTIENSKFTVFDSKKLKSEGQADVYLPTLAPFRAKADGTMSLSGLKKMTATEGFLARDESFRGCSLQSFDKCQTKELLQTCGCLPWGLSPTLPEKVREHCQKFKIETSSQSGFNK